MIIEVSASGSPGERRSLAETLKQTLMRDDRWSEGLAVGSSGFVSKVKKDLGAGATEPDGTFTLRGPEEAYSDVLGAEYGALSLDNRRFWDDSRDRTAR